METQTKNMLAGGGIGLGAGISLSVFNSLLNTALTKARDTNNANFNNMLNLGISKTEQGKTLLTSTENVSASLFKTIKAGKIFSWAIIPLGVALGAILGYAFSERTPQQDQNKQ